MRKLGFVELIKPEYQTYIITSYYYPQTPFNFEKFYNKLSEKSNKKKKNALDNFISSYF